jgi:Zn-dependent peptidase ImmA (M78 family)
MGVGYYQAANPASIPFLQAGTLPAQIFLLLHELAHYFQASGFIMTDGSIQAQATNNDLLLKKCAKTIQVPTA